MAGNRGVKPSWERPRPVARGKKLSQASALQRVWDLARDWVEPVLTGERSGRGGGSWDGDTPSLPGRGGNSVCIKGGIGLESPFRLAGWIHLVGRFAE